MEKYAIYRYYLTTKRVRAPKFSCEGEATQDKLSAEEKFERLFGWKKGSQLKIQKLKKKGEAEKFPCFVVNHDSNVILLQLENSKNVDIWEEQPTNGPIPKIEKTKKVSTPYCYVIIDNRPNAQHIVIQSANAAWKNPDNIKDLLQESLNWLMEINDYGLEIEIKTIMLPTKFWEYVNYRRKKENVFIKGISFFFTNSKRRPDIDIKKILLKRNNHINSAIDWIDNLGGEKAELRITSPRNEAMLQRKKADIQHMIELSLASDNYSLSVTFSDNIIYQCNQEMHAEYPMDDKTIREEFADGFGDIFQNYRILLWLNNVVEHTKHYHDVEKVRPKPGKSRKIVQEQVG